MEDDLNFSARITPLPRAEPRPRPSLQNFTDEELRAELRRRRKRERPRKLSPCDECANFRAYEGNGDPPKDFNPCAKGHQMAFKMPEDYGAEEVWGFHRTGCRDRKKAPQDAR